MEGAIDVRYSELFTWLESRYLIPKDWAKKLELIGVKKSDFLDAFFKKDTAEMKKLQENFKNFNNNHENMTYMDIVRLNSLLLKSEEAKSKTLFGNYNSQFIKDSNLLVGIYNKDNMHLSESTKLILQYIGYELPNLEKNTLYIEKNINEYESKISDKKLQSEKNNSKIKELFKKYNIKEVEKSNEIALLLVKRLESLEKHIKELESKLMNKSIAEAIRVYQLFYKKIFNKEFEEVDPTILKVLKNANKQGDYLIDGNLGNKYNLIKNKIEEYKQIYENIDIQADIEAHMWNFKLVEGKETLKSTTTTCLLNPTTRRQLKNELNELLIFITFRIEQYNNKDETNLSIYHPNLRDINLEINQESLQSSKNFISQVLKSFEDPDIIFLLDIFDDEKNLKLILNSFEMLKTDNKKLCSTISDMNSKIEENKKEISENQKKVVQLKKDAKLIKKQMEKFLTDTLKRKITIIGDINLL